MPYPSPSLLICSALALALTAQAALAAPKNDKANPHAGGQHSEMGGQVHGPAIDIERVRRVLGENRQLIGQASALPPGIAKNLARGKPLPPGIAKNFDGRVASQLPHYDGYQWQQVGTDVALVAVGTGIVQEVLRNVLD